MRQAIVFASLFVAASTMACAGSNRVVTQRTQTSMAAIRAAEEVGAGKAPRASLHLQLAKEQVESAKVLSSKGKKEEAASLLLRAEADAELAVMLSREQSEKTEASEAIERVRKLKQENQ